MLLKLILAQRLEMNVIESALQNAGVLTKSQIDEIRRQAAKSAEDWSRGGETELLKLIRAHSMPGATMLVPLGQDEKEALRREIDDQTPQR